MVAQGFCTTHSIPDPLAHSGGGTSSLQVGVASPLTVIWADGKPNDSYTPSGANGMPCLSIYDSSATFDGGSFVWLIIFSQGTPNPWAVKESDYANLSTLVDAVHGGEWALYARIDGDQRYRIAQV